MKGHYSLFHAMQRDCQLQQFLLAGLAGFATMCLDVNADRRRWEELTKAGENFGSSTTPAIG